MRNDLLLFAFVVALISCRGKYTDAFDPVVDNSTNRLAQPVRVTAGIESSFSADLSPNGKFILYVSDRAGNRDVWEKKVDGGYPRQLTSHPADDFGPVVSPNGKHAAFVSRRLDALGDIAVLDLGETFSKMLANGEGDISQFSQESSKDYWPTWFSDSKRLAFVSRRIGTSEPRIRMLDTRDNKISDFQRELIGEQPAVSHDDKYLAFVKDGKIHLYDIEADKVHQITSGEGVLDGQPAFSTDDAALTFIRYAEDSNGDLVIDANDNAVVWRLYINEHLDGKITAKNFYEQPLTSAEYSSLRPVVRSPFIYFTRQNQDGLDIFRVPEQGIVANFSSAKDVMQIFHQQAGVSDRLFILRRGQADLARAEKFDDLTELAKTELDYLAELGRAAEVRWVNIRLKNAFPKERALQIYGTLVEEELALKLNFSPGEPSFRGYDTKKIKSLISRTKKVIKQYTGQESEFDFVRAKARLTLAKSYFSLGKKRAGEQILDELIASDQALNRIEIARARLYYAKKKAEAEQPTLGMRECLQIARDYRHYGVVVEAAAELAISLAERSADINRALQNLVAEAAGVMPFRSFIHQRIVDSHIAGGRTLVATNELKAMFSYEGNSAATMLATGRQLAELYETQSQPAEADRLYNELIAKLKGSEEELDTAKSYRNEFYLRRAERYLGQRNFRRAEREFDRVLTRDPLNVAAQAGKIDTLFLLDKLAPYLPQLESIAQENLDDPRYIFYLAYAKTQALKSEVDEDKRKALIERSIQRLERARELDGQIALVHQTLGDLYYERGVLTQLESHRTSFGARMRRSWELVAEYFGWGEEPWFKQSVDAYLSAYYIAKKGSVTRVALAEKLGDGFFHLENYARSLHYYMERIRAVAHTPVRSAAVEAKIFRRAGRSAFYIDDLQAATSLQEQEVRTWKKIKDNDGIARALDSLALTLRSAKQFEKAILVYQELLELQSTAKNTDNITLTLINLGFCANELDRAELGLDYLERAEKRITQRSSKSFKKMLDGEIKVNLSGQASDAYGFDTTTQKILIQTLRVGLFQKMRRLDLAEQAQNLKTQLMMEKRASGQKQQKGDNYYLEELSIAWNQLGDLQTKLGRYEPASTSFLQAAELARALRPTERGHPTRAEVLNLVNYGRVAVRMSDLGQPVTESNKGALNKLLEAQIELNKGYAGGDVEAAQYLIDINLLLAKLDPEKQGLVRKSRDLQLSVGRDPKALAETMLAYDFSDLRKADIALRSDYRKTFLADPEMSYKYYAKNADYRAAFEDATAHILSGQTLRLANDRKLYRRSFETAARQLDEGSEARKALLTQYLNAAALEVGIRAISGHKSSPELKTRVKGLFVKEFDHENLGAKRALIMFHIFENGAWDVYFTTQIGSSGFTARNKDEALNSISALLNSQDERIGSAILVGHVGSEEPILGNLAQSIPVGGLSVIAAPALVQAHFDRKIIPKASVLHLSPTASEAIAKANGQRYYLNSNTDLPSSKDEFNIIHDGRDLLVSPFEPAQSLIKSLDTSTYDKPLAEFSLQSFDSTGLYLFAKSADGAFSSAQGWIAVELASLLAGLPTIGMIEKSDDESWKSFYQQTFSVDYATAFSTSGLEGWLIGFPGVDREYELEVASRQLQRLIDAGQKAALTADYDAAAHSYKEAMYYANQLGRNQEEQSLLVKLIEALYLKKDYRFALQYQDKIVNLAMLGGDPAAYSTELLTASILALESGQLRQARQYLSTASDVANLGDLDEVQQIRRVEHDIKLSLAEGQPIQAVAKIEASTQLFSPEQVLLKKIGVLASQPHLLSEALEAIEMLPASARESQALAETYIKLLLRTTRLGDAVAAIGESDVHTNVPNLASKIDLMTKAEVLAATGRFSRSLELWEQTAAGMNKSLGLARLTMRERRYADALQALVPLFYQSDGFYKTEVGRLIGICHSYLGNTATAATFFLDAAALAESIADRQQEARIRASFARQRWNAGDSAEARRQFNLAKDRFTDRLDTVLFNEVTLGLLLTAGQENESMAAAKGAFRDVEKLSEPTIKWQMGVVFPHLFEDEQTRDVMNKAFMASSQAITIENPDDAFGRALSPRKYLALALTQARSDQQRFALTDKFHGLVVPDLRGRELMFEQNADEDLCIAEYFWAEDAVYRVFISRGQTVTRKLAVKPGDLDQQLSIYSSVMQAFGSSEGIAGELFDAVLSDADLSVCSDLIVIPDGKLHDVSFTQLVSHAQSELTVWYTINVASLYAGSKRHHGAPDAINFVGGAEAERDVLAGQEKQRATRFAGQERRGVVFDLRENELTLMGTAAPEGSGTSYASASSAVPRGQIYFGHRLSSDNNSLAHYAGLIWQKGFEVAFLAPWRYEPIGVALTADLCHRSLVQGHALRTSVSASTAKVKENYAHPAAWAAIKPYIFNLETILRDAEPAH